MNRRNPNWPNPDYPLQVSPEDYERQVQQWVIEASRVEGRSIRWDHRELVKGNGGDYQIDVYGELDILGGAAIKLLVECKRTRRPVEREEMLAFAMKLQDTSSHKGMMFSTAGYQSGAIQFAASRGIAAITFVDGQPKYETKSRSQSQPPHYRSATLKYGGWFMTIEETGARSRWLDSKLLAPVVEWIRCCPDGPHSNDGD